MGLIDRLRGREEHRDAFPELSLDDYIALLSAYGPYGAGVSYTMPGAKQEEISWEYRSLAQQAYRSNGIVAAVLQTRMRIFCEARFQWRRTGTEELFGSPELAPLEQPWPGATTWDLLARAVTYHDLAGNFYCARRPGGRLFPLRPDWTYILIGSEQDDEILAWDVDSHVVGYLYQPGGPGSGRKAVPFLADEVAHWKMIPDPEAQFRGMSWLTPVIREVMADKAMTDHKLAFLENSATPQLAVKLDVPDLDQMKKWIQLLKDNHEGRWNAGKTMYLGAGADVTVVGANLEQLDFKVTQGAGETRVTMAGGVPAVIAGSSEGLQAATYSNYGQARRHMADATSWPMWRSFGGAMGNIIQPPAGGPAELWPDASAIPFLREDQADQSTIDMNKTAAINTLVTGGFDPASAVQAIAPEWADTLSHTGLTSVQLLPPGQTKPADGPDTNQAEALRRPKGA